MKRWYIAAILALASCLFMSPADAWTRHRTPSPTPTPTPPTVYTPQTIPNPIYGATLDDLSNLSGIINSLSKLPYKPTVRVVFDTGVSAATYYPQLAQLHQYAYIVGEILDSSYFPTTLSYYQTRTNELVSTLYKVVDVWEIANEINGEWLRPNPGGSDSTVASQEAQIAQMVLSAYNIVKSWGGKVAVTLYYNDDGSNNCWQNWQDSWYTWPTQFLSATVRNGADYAFFSYYPYQDCPGLSPVWADDFGSLEAMFPNAKVGFGEIGTSSTGAPWSVQSGLIKQYYPMVNTFADPKFVGGFFWWNYAEQMVPATTQYWVLLNSTLGGLKAPQ